MHVPYKSVKKILNDPANIVTFCSGIYVEFVAFLQVHNQLQEDESTTTDKIHYSNCH